MTFLPPSPPKGNPPGDLERAEHVTLIHALIRVGGNVSRVARELGAGRALLYRRMKRLGIPG